MKKNFDPSEYKIKQITEQLYKSKITMIISFLNLSQSFHRWLSK